MPHLNMELGMLSQTDQKVSVVAVATGHESHVL